MYKPGLLKVGMSPRSPDLYQTITLGAQCGSVAVRRHPHIRYTIPYLGIYPWIRELANV